MDYFQFFGVTGQKENSTFLGVVIWKVVASAGLCLFIFW